MSLSTLLARRQKADALPAEEREKYKAGYDRIVTGIEDKTYAKTIIKLSVNVEEGMASGEYVFIVTDCTGKEIYRHILKAEGLSEVAMFVNKKFADNTRFKNIVGFYTRSTGVFRAYFSDTNRTVSTPTTQ